MSIGIDKLAHMNNPALSDILLAHSAAEGTGVVAIGDLPKLLNAGNLKMSDSDETIAEHYRQFCNRNLLDNWYFANSVNQKGQDEYGGGYGIDRWKSDGTTVLNDGSVAFSSNFYQKVPVEELKKRFLGKQLTLSALYTDGTLEFGTLTVPTQYPSSNQILFATPAGLAVALTTDGGPQIFRRQYTNKGVVAVKTEFGSHQTLAHKEGSKWVLNEIPDYATELAKCQRYFWRYKFIGEWSKTAFIQAFTATRLEGQFIAPVQMRILPTIKTNIGDDELIATKNANVDIPVKYKGVIACGDTYRNLWLTFEPLDSSKVVLGDTYFLRNQNNKNIYLDFDANL